LSYSIGSRHEHHNERNERMNEAIEHREAGFVAGAMWAARELGHPGAEAVAFFERAQVAAQEGYEADDRDGGDE
jgi:hypothetical protein